MITLGRMITVEMITFGLAGAMVQQPDDTLLAREATLKNAACAVKP